MVGVSWGSVKRLEFCFRKVRKLLLEFFLDIGISRVGGDGYGAFLGMVVF